MALARVQYTQTESGNRNFMVPFPYISRDHVHCSIDGEDVSFTWLNSTTVQLAGSPSVGTIIDIRRETERAKLLVDFQDASTITEQQLDLSAKQAFFIAQEAFDATGGTMAVANDGSYSANNRRISNVGDPDSDDDAATVAWVKAQYNSGYDAHEERLAAAASASLSSSRADAANNSAYLAANSATSASASASQATTALDAVNAKAAQVATDAATSTEARKTATQAATSAEADRSLAQTAANTATSARAAAVTAASQAEAAKQTVTTIETRIKETTTMDFLNFEIVGPNLVAHFMGYSTESNFTINDKGELEVIL